MLPEGFVYLDEIDSSIAFDIRYATATNFTGTIIEGYKANRAVMTKELAEALSKVQKIVAKDGYSLVIYDAYRPRKAVEYFVRWAAAAEVIDMKGEFYPDVDRSKSFELGYISNKSAHCRGSTVDLSLIEKSAKLKPVVKTVRKLSDGREITFLDDGSLDMGSHFDLFDRASWHEDTLFSGEFLKRRLYLQSVMLQNGFDDYRKEWWHYSLKDEPFPNTNFDFDVA